MTNNYVHQLQALRHYAEQNNIPIVGEQVEQVLIALLSVAKPKKILEIGTAIGYSGTVLLTNSDELSRLYTIEISEDRLKMARQSFQDLKLADRVTIYQGDACDIVPMLTGVYDFIFLDGPKGQYLNFLPYLLSLLRIGGLLVCDNVYFHGMVTGEDVGHKNRTIHVNMLEFIESIRTNKCLMTEILDCGDGMAISYKHKDK